MCTAAPQMGSTASTAEVTSCFDWTRWCKWDLVVVFCDIMCCHADPVLQEGKELDFQLAEASDLSFICIMSIRILTWFF